MERLDLQNGYLPIEMAIHSARYMPLLRAVVGRQVLDIACGEGLGAALMARWGAASVTGVDLSELAVAKAAEFARQSDAPNTSFIAADACDWLEATDRRFDVISSVETIEHLPDPERFLRLCRARLADDGLLLVSCPNDPYYYGVGQSLNPYHVTSYSFETFRDMAEGILGPGQWMLGAPLYGFLTASKDRLITDADAYAGAMADASDGDVSLLPLRDDQPAALAPDDAIYFVGIWGGPRDAAQRDLMQTERPQAVVIPMASDQRMPGLRRVPVDVAHGHERSLWLYHAVETSGPQPGAVDRLTAQLAGRYRVKPTPVGAQPAKPAAGRAARKSRDAASLFRGCNNAHFDDEALLAECFAGISASAPDDPRRDQLAKTVLTVRLRGGQDLADPDRRRRLMMCDGVMVDDPAMIASLRDLTGLSAMLSPWMSAGPGPEDAAGQEPPPRAPAADAPIRLLMLSDAKLPTGKAAAGVTIRHLSGDDASLARMTTADAGTTALIATRDDHAAQAIIERAMARGAAVILPRQHPMAGLIEADWRIDDLNAGTLAQVIDRLQAARRGGDAGGNWPGAANIATMADLGSVGHAARWTRFLALAQERNRALGRYLRAAWLAG